MTIIYYDARDEIGSHVRAHVLLSIFACLGTCMCEPNNEILERTTTTVIVIVMCRSSKEQGHGSKRSELQGARSWV